METNNEIQSTPDMISTFNTFGRFIFGYDDWVDEEDHWIYLEDHLTVPEILNIPLYDLFICILDNHILWKQKFTQDKDIHIITLYDSFGKWTYQFEFNK